MTAITQSGLDALIARRRPGHSLEAAFYTSQNVFDPDLRLIFGRHWIFVASEPEIPEPGDYVTVQFSGTSVILVRDDMTVRFPQRLPAPRRGHPAGRQGLRRQLRLPLPLIDLRLCGRADPR